MCPQLNFARVNISVEAVYPPESEWVSKVFNRDFQRLSNLTEGRNKSMGCDNREVQGHKVVI